MKLAHGTCIAIDGKGVLLRGRSGAGKSDLAVRLIDDGAVLVADDQVELESRGGRVMARPPATIAGQIEVRGVGIVKLRHLPEAALALVVDLVASDGIERLPEPATAQICGIELPLVRLEPFAASAPAKLRLALRMAVPDAGGIMRPR